ncbi:MAG: hypothetical protein HZB14_05150 [Actinobacteria bacterium]|nr:hypothetical protein [Actinomycetota bacterium]
MDFEGDRKRRLIGIGVILLLAAGFVALPGGDDAKDVVSAAVQAAFLAAIAWSGWMLYRTRSTWLAELPERDRGILYAALAAGLLTVVGRGRFSEIGEGGTLLWLGVLAGCGFAVFWVWRESRRFSY